jgi:hypothetical protein
VLPAAPGRALSTSDPVSGASDATRRTVLVEMAQALMPLVRLYLGAGLGTSDFGTAAKLAFMRVASENTLNGKRMNVSAIAAATGMTRREVRSLAALVNESASVPTRKFTHQRTTRVIHGWQTDPMFLNEDGHPAILPLRGAGISFATLVTRYGADVTPISVLNQLERAGAVTRSQSDTVRLLKQSTRMRGYNSESIADVTTHVRDLAMTLVSNIEKADRPTFTGFQELTKLPPDVAALFISAFSERGALLLDGVERWAATQQRQRKESDTPPSARRRVGIGVYLVDEPAKGDAPLPPSPAKGRMRKP